MANGFINRDLVWGAAAFDLAREHLPNPGNAVIVSDQYCDRVISSLAMGSTRREGEGAV